MSTGIPGQLFQQEHSKIIAQNVNGNVENFSRNTVNVIKGPVYYDTDLSQKIRHILGSQVVEHAQIASFQKPLCWPGTRTTLLEQIDEWIKDPVQHSLHPTASPTTPRCACIIGVPGTGKSTILATIAYRLNNLTSPYGRVIGAHYFLRRDIDTTINPSHVFPTLAYQLSVLDPGIADRLHRSISSSAMASVPVQDQAERLLVQPIHDFKGIVVLIVDAIDESSSPATFARALAGLIQILPPNARLILSTRNEHDVLQNLNAAVSQLFLEVPAEESVQDVRLYLEHRLKEEVGIMFGEDGYWDDWPSMDQLDALSLQASGLFVWAATAIAFIISAVDMAGEEGRDEAISEVSKEGMSDVNQLYALVLQRALGERKGPKDAARFENVKKLLGLLVVIGRPLELATIRSLLGLPRTSFDVKRFFQRARSVIVPGSRPIDEATIPQMHKSFIDFITHPHAGEFQVDEKGHHTLTLNRSFDIMQSGLHFNMGNLRSSFLLNKDVPGLQEHVDSMAKELVYACHFWGYHLRRAGGISSDKAEPFMNEKLLFWLEVMGLTGETDLARGAFSVLASKNMILAQDELVSSSLANLARDVLHFIVDFGPTIEASTPHLYVSAFAFSPTGSVVLACYNNGSQLGPPVTATSGKRKGWDPCVAILRGHKDGIESVAISSDGRTILSASRDRTMRTWDLQTGELVGEPLIGHLGGVRPGHRLEGLRAVCFSPDGRQIASGSVDHTIRIWDVQTRKCVRESMKAHQGEVNAICWSSDGTRLASGSEDQTVCLWDVATGALICPPLKGHSSYVLSVSFSPDGRLLGSAGIPSLICIRDAHTGQLLREVEWPLGHSKTAHCVSFSPDSKLLLSGSRDGSIHVWDANTMQPVGNQLQCHPSGVSSICFAPSGQYVASGHDNGTIIVWDSATRKAATDPILGHTTYVNSLCFSPDGTLLVTGSGDGTVRIWDVQQLIQSAIKGTSSSSVNSLCYSRDGKTIVCGLSDKTIRMFDPVAGAFVNGKILRGHTERVCAVALSPDGTLLASGSDDNTIRLWDVLTMEPVGSPLIGPTDRVETVCFSPDGKKLASASDDQIIRLWDVATGHAIGDPRICYADLNLVCFLPHKPSVLLYTNGSFISTVDGETGEVVENVLRLKSYSGPPNSLAFSADGGLLATASLETVGLKNRYALRIWNFNKSAQSRTIKQSRIIAHKHTRSITTTIFSTDGTCIISGADDGTIRVNDVKTGQAKFGPLCGHTDVINTIAPSPDGQYIASGSDDGIIRIWDLSILEDRMLDTGEERKWTQGASGPPRRSALFTDQSMVDEEGWVQGPGGVHLFWVPEIYRSGLWRPGNSIVGGQDAVKLDVSRLVSGEEWLTFFQTSSGSL